MFLNCLSEGYHCLSCSTKGTGSRLVQKATFPSLLIVQLQRTVDFVRKTLCVAGVSLLRHIPSEVLGHSYNLSAVITHFGYYQDDKHGSAGHFVCYIHHNAQWYLLNDDKVSVVDERIVLTSPWWLALYKKGAGVFPFLLFRFLNA